MENPFEEASFFTSNTQIYNKLFSSSIMWSTMISNENDMTDEVLDMIFIAEDFPLSVRVSYEAFRETKGNIDIKALKNALETWVFSNL